MGNNRTINREIVKNLHTDFTKQLVLDLTNVLLDTYEDKYLFDKLLDNIDAIGLFTPDIHALSKVRYNEGDSIFDMPLIRRFEPDSDTGNEDHSFVTVKGLIERGVDAKWHDMIMYYVWLIATSTYVYAAPGHLDDFKTIATDENISLETFDLQKDPVFSTYVRNLFQAKAVHSKTKEGQLDSIFERTFNRDGAISKLAQEITDELSLDEKFKSPEDVLNLLNTSSPNSILGDVISKVGNKLHSKLQSNEIKQEDLVKEAMEMMSSLQQSFPICNIASSLSPKCSSSRSSQRKGSKRRTPHNNNPSFDVSDTLPSLMQLMGMLSTAQGKIA